MYPYIVCNCGASIGDIYPAFKALRAREYKRHFERTGKYVTPEQFAFSEDMQVPLRGVFELLKVRLSCCKCRLMTQVEYKTLY